jgi:anti-sigma B factor antagonist
MELAKEGLITSRTVDSVTVLGFTRGGIREEREILKTFESLARYIEARDGLRILLDLSNIEYLSSAGLGHLVGLLKRARARSSTLKLCALQTPIQELFEVMRLTRIFEIHGSVTEAIESFKADPGDAPKPKTEARK